jgi:hypothetical protein
MEQWPKVSILANQKAPIMSLRCSEGTFNTFGVVPPFDTYRQLRWRLFTLKPFGLSAGALLNPDSCTPNGVLTKRELCATNILLLRSSQHIRIDILKMYHYREVAPLRSANETGTCATNILLPRSTQPIRIDILKIYHYHEVALLTEC